MSDKELVCAHYQRLRSQCVRHREGNCGGDMYVRVAVIDEVDGGTDTSIVQLCHVHAKLETSQFEHPGTTYELKDVDDDGWSVVPLKIPEQGNPKE